MTTTTTFWNIGKANARIKELEARLGAQPTPAPQPGRPSPADVQDANVRNNALEIARLETQLGLPSSAFEARLAMSRARLEVLRQMVGLTPPATFTAPVAPVAAAEAAIAAAKGTPTTLDAGKLTASLAEFYRMDAATRTQFAADGGALAKSDFDRLTLAAKSKFAVAGGKIIDDAPANPRNLSTAARSFGHK